MKKKIITIVVLLTGLMFLACYCKDDGTSFVPPTNPALYPVSIKITEGNGNVEPLGLKGLAFDSLLTIKVKPDEGSYFFLVRVNGEKIDLPITSEEFEFSIKGLKSRQDLEFIFVEENIFLLTNPEPPWSSLEMDIYLEDGALWDSFNFPPEIKNRKDYYSYYPTKRLKVYEENGKDLYAEFDWDLYKDTLVIGAMHYKILELTEDRLVYMAPPGPDPSTGIMNYAQYTYKRVKEE